MRALVFVVELVFWLFLVRLLLRLLAAVLRGPSTRAAGPRAAPRAIEDLVQDPVCHAYLPRSRAISARIAGREQHFCSPACRDKAQAAVARAS